jgi:hypothetical protein
LRLILGMILLTISDLVMWQNPVARTWGEWPLRLVVYVALAAWMLDFAVRFQVRGPATLLLLSTAYALMHSATLNPGAFDNFPITLVVRGLGLQIAAAVYGLLLFVVVMRGRQPDGLQVLAAVGIGLVWGIWTHWYPLQTSVAWGLVSLETAQTYLLVALVIVGVLFWVIGPRFRVVRERDFELVWWERVIAVVPLFVALLAGMIQNVIPFLPLLPMIAVGVFVGWALNWQRGGYEPSLLAQLMFAAPNLITYVVVSIIFLAVGTLSYGLIADKDSILGIIVYVLVLGFGAAALPGASLLIFWRYYTLRNQPAPVADQPPGDGAESD